MFSYNSIRPDDLGVSVKDLQRTITPVLGSVSRTSKGGVGSTFIKRTVGERNTQITLQIKGAKTYQELQTIATRVAEWFNVEEPKKLVFDDKPNKYLLAIASGELDLSQTYTYGIVKVKLVSHDPHYYASAQTTNTLTGTGTFTNQSTMRTYWEMTVKFNSNMSGVQFALGDSIIKLTGDYVANDAVFITSDGLVQYNGRKNMSKLTLDSKLKHLGVGEVSYTFPANTTATLRYRGVYIN